MKIYQETKVVGSTIHTTIKVKSISRKMQRKLPLERVRHRIWLYKSPLMIFGIRFNAIFSTVANAFHTSRHLYVGQNGRLDSLMGLFSHASISTYCKFKTSNLIPHTPKFAMDLYYAIRTKRKH